MELIRKWNQISLILRIVMGLALGAVSGFPRPLPSGRLERPGCWPKGTSQGHGQEPLNWVLMPKQPGHSLP